MKRIFYVLILIISILIFASCSSSIYETRYKGQETVEAVKVSELSFEEKEQFQFAVDNMQNYQINGKKIKDVITIGKEEAEKREIEKQEQERKQREQEQEEQEKKRQWEVDKYQFLQELIGETNNINKNDNDDAATIYSGIELKLLEKYNLELVSYYNGFSYINNVRTYGGIQGTKKTDRGLAGTEDDEIRTLYFYYDHKYILANMQSSLSDPKRSKYWNDDYIEFHIESAKNILSGISPDYKGINHEEIIKYCLDYFESLEEWQILHDDFIIRERILLESPKVPEPYRPRIGMTADQVKNSIWGKPDKINRTTTKYGVSEQWVYEYYGYIYLDDGIVTGIQD